MARYDLHALNGGLVVDLQSDLIEIPGSRVVAPLVQEKAAPPSTRSLHPRVTVKGEAFVVATHLLAAAPVGMLKAPVGNLSDHQDAFTLALDMLFHGF